MHSRTVRETSYSRDHADVIAWLLEGDISIRFQAYRDLLDEHEPALQKRIAKEGWGLRLLDAQHPGAYWGRGFYMPKWSSSHYTLLDLRNLCISPDCRAAKSSIAGILEKHKASDGGINPNTGIQVSDVCINGMFLNYASYFRADEQLLQSVVDFILNQVMPDGGFNCRSNRGGAVHSSLHTTLSVLEGIHEYRTNHYTYRLDELTEAETSSREFILQHQLFLSDRTGKVIHPDFLRLRYPFRWHYNLLRALDYFRNSLTPYDTRMDKAISYLIGKRRPDGTWKLASGYPGEVHVVMEKAGKPSRWVTLLAMRILKHYKIRA